MGNEQSIPALRRPANKLSKPRTNSSVPPTSRASAGISRHNSALGDVGVSSVQHSSLSLDAVGEAGRGRGRTKEDPIQRKRIGIFRSRSSQAKSQLDITNGAHIDYLNESPVRSPVDRPDKWSRNSSVVDLKREPQWTIPAQRNARMSLQHLPPHAQHQARLSLVPEAPSPRPETMFRRHSILPQRDSVKRPSIVSAQATIPRLEPALPRLDDRPRQQSIKRHSILAAHPTVPRLDAYPQLSPLLTTRTHSDTQLYAPIRRRSLLAHGVATRDSWVEGDPRQTLPSQSAQHSELRDLYYNPAKPTSSPLTDLANMRPNFPDFIPGGPRAQTPNDFEYGHIGAYKLGSLRITNGAASPAPSLEGSPPTKRAEDYVSAGEGRLAERRALNHRSHTVSVPPEHVKTPWITRAESPLSHELAQADALRPLTVDTHLPLPEFSLFKFTDLHSPTRSLDLARGYQHDLALSPFSFENSPPASPTLESTSKPTEMDDNLFEAEPGTPDITGRAPRSFDSGYRAEDVALPSKPKVVKGPKELTPKPLAKADSGYSSNVSLRSFKGNQAPTVPAKESLPIPPKPTTARDTSSTYSISSTYSTISEATIRPPIPGPVHSSSYNIPALPIREAPSVPQKDPVVSRSRNSLPALPRKSPQQTLAARSKSPAISTPKQKHESTKSTPNTKLAVQESREARHSPSGSDVSTASSSSSSRWRLRSNSRSQSAIQLPQLQPIFTVQAARATDSQLNHNIPSVSPEAARHLAQRVNDFPVNCLPNTTDYNTKIRRMGSKETLGTIFSVGSAEWRDELPTGRLHSALPPVPPTIPESPGPRPEPNRRYTYQPQTPVLAVQTRKPVPQSQSYQTTPVQRDNPGLQRKLQQDFQTQITSFENISSGLGNSPYDVASANAKTRQQERAKSLTAQFEADAAARFAQRRPVSPKSQSSASMHKSTSYESIANQNPFLSPTYSRGSGRGAPPSAHQNANPRQMRQRSNPNLKAEMNGTTVTRMKSPPPVAMQTQARNSVAFSKPAVLGPPPNRTPPQPPVQEDPWAAQHDYWTNRKEEAIKAIRSIEMNMPEPPANQGISIRRPESAGVVSEQEPEWLKKRVSFEGTPLSQSKSEERKRQLATGAGKTFRSWDNSAQRWDGYDHTYGTYVYPRQGYEQDAEYYDGPSQNTDQMAFKDRRLSQAIQRSSTSDMLALDDRLGYDYGLGGNTRPRSSRMSNVDIDMHYGVDYSDIPVLPQGIRVQS